VEKGVGFLVDMKKSVTFGKKNSDKGDAKIDIIIS